MARLTRAERTVIWQQRVDRYLQSKQTVADFCKSEGISVPSFYEWKRRLISQRHADELPRREVAFSDAKPSHRKAASTPFAELVVTEQHETARAQLPNGISISLGRDVAIAAAIVDRLMGYQPVADVTESPSASRRSC
jgi:transposase-like protein